MNIKYNHKFIYSIFYKVFIFLNISISTLFGSIEVYADTDSSLNMAVLKYNESKYEESLKELDLIMKQQYYKKLSFMDQKPYLLLLSKIKAQLHDIDSSKNILKDIISKDKYYFEAYIVLSKLYRYNNQYDASITILNKGLDRLLSYSKDVNDSDFNKFLDTNISKNIEKQFYNNLSLTYLYSFDDKNASYYLNKSLSIFPKDQETLLIKSVYLYTINDYKTSLEVLNSILDEDTNINDNQDKNLCFKYYLKSKILDNISQLDQSLYYMKKALYLDKNNMGLKLDLARLLKDKFHNINEAYPYLNEVKNLGNIDQKKISSYYLYTMDL